MSDIPLITLEDDNGAAPLPPELTNAAPAQAEAPPVQPEAEPVAAAESKAPASTAPVTPPAVAPTAQPPAPPVDPRHQGMLRDLQDERGRRQSAESRVSELEQTAQLGRELAAALDRFPDLKDQLIARATGQTPPQDGLAPHQLRELAETVGVYDREGKADLSAAQRIAALVKETAAAEARKAVEAAVKPIQQEQVQTAATTRYNEARQVAQQVGIDQSIYDEVFNQTMQTNPKMMADPQQATGTLIFAAGLQYLRAKGLLPGGAPPSQPAAPAAQPARPAVTPPVVTDRGSGRGNTPTITRMEQQQIKRAGVNQDAYLKITSLLENAAPTGKHQTFVMEED